MDILYNELPWKKLINKCMEPDPDSDQTTDESLKNDECIERWAPYVDGGFANKQQTKDQYKYFVFKVVTPKVISALEERNIINSDQVKRIKNEVVKCSSADTACFNQHTRDTTIEDLVVEAIVRIAVLCYALNQSRALREDEYKDADQILVDTFNIEVPYLNKLSDKLPAFRDEFWSGEISKACGEYIADYADEFPHLLLSEQEAKEGGIEVLDPRQLQISLTLTR